MSVTDYLTARRTGEVLNDTLLHTAVSAYVKAEEALIGADGLVDKSKLKDPSTRKNISSIVYSSLVGFSLAYFGATTADETRQEQLAFGLFGMNTSAIGKYVDDNQEKAGIFEFLNYAQRNTPFGYFMRQNSSDRPKTKLEMSDADEVVTITKTTGVVDPTKLTLDEMVELLDEHDTQGAIRPAFLKGKHYAV